MQRTVKLKITTTRKRAINISSSALHAFCADCGREVQTLTCAAAAEFLETGAQNIEDLIAADKLHAIRTVNGGWRVCQNSLTLQ